MAKATHFTFGSSLGHSGASPFSDGSALQTVKSKQIASSTPTQQAVIVILYFMIVNCDVRPPIADDRLTAVASGPRSELPMDGFSQ